MFKRIANFFRFWTRAQIGGQYTPRYESWQAEHTEWMHAHGLEPLTYDAPSNVTIRIDHLDGNDNWKNKGKDHRKNVD